MKLWMVLVACLVTSTGVAQDKRITPADRKKKQDLIQEKNKTKKPQVETVPSQKLSELDRLRIEWYREVIKLGNIRGR